MWILGLKGLSACYCFLFDQRPGTSQLNLLLSLCVSGHVASVQTACVCFLKMFSKRKESHMNAFFLCRILLSNLFYKVRRFLDVVFLNNSPEA